jgi:hypothetical protein
VPRGAFGTPRGVDVLDEPAPRDSERHQRGEAECNHETGANDLMIKL